MLVVEWAANNTELSLIIQHISTAIFEELLEYKYVWILFKHKEGGGGYIMYVWKKKNYKHYFLYKILYYNMYILKWHHHQYLLQT